jgi:curli biogenesis system outer membrane secretion channel CsgG
MLKSAKILLAALAAAGAAWAGWEGYRLVARAMTEGAEKKEIRRVAVFGFSSESGEATRASAIVTERLTTELAGSPKVQVIERGRLEEVLREQNLGSRGVVDSATAKRIGNILGADAVVTGTVIELSDKKVEVNARLVDTQDARIIKAVSRTVAKDWEDKRDGWKGFDLNVNINLDAPAALLPDGFLEDETCGRLTPAEKEAVLDCVKLKAHKTAWDLKSGALKLDQITRNPGSEIRNQELKHLYYSRIKEIYYQPGLRELPPAAGAELAACAPSVSRYPCR